MSVQKREQSQRQRFSTFSAAASAAAMVTLLAGCIQHQGTPQGHGDASPYIAGAPEAGRAPSTPFAGAERGDSEGRVPEAASPSPSAGEDPRPPSARP